MRNNDKIALLQICDEYYQQLQNAPPTKRALVDFKNSPKSRLPIIVGDNMGPGLTAHFGAFSGMIEHPSELILQIKRVIRAHRSSKFVLAHDFFGAASL